MLTIEKYVRAASLEEAWELNQKKRNRILGGMLWMKMEKGSVDTAIDLGGLGLDTIEETEDAFAIGAMVSLRQLEQHKGLNAYCQNAVRDALQDIVGVQFRNCATVGGSIWGRFGFSDVLTVFLPMDCYVELYKGGTVPLHEFAQMTPDNDILVRLIVKKTPMEMTYSAMRIQRTDFPVLTAAVAKLDGAYRAAVGARPGRALLVTAQTAEELLSLAAALPTGSNNRGSSQYRTHLIKVLTERALKKLGGMA